MNGLAELVLELSNAFPWPWRLIPAVGVSLSVVILLGRFTALGLLAVEGTVTASRRARGDRPGALSHAVGDGLDLFGRALSKVYWWPLALSVGVAVVVSLGVAAEASWAVDARTTMTSYEDRILRAGSDFG